MSRLLTKIGSPNIALQSNSEACVSFSAVRLSLSNPAAPMLYAISLELPHEPPCVSLKIAQGWTLTIGKPTMSHTRCGPLLGDDDA